MRVPVTRERVEAFMRSIGPVAVQDTRLYFTGGATAVLLGWRESTLDLDIRFVPEQDCLLRAIPELKERHSINIELVWPPDFLPELPGWEARSLYVGREGRITFYHYDPYSQALAKVERGHARDIRDVEQLVSGGFVHPSRAWELFETIRPLLYRFPAIDPGAFAGRMRAAFGPPPGSAR